MEQAPTVFDWKGLLLAGGLFLIFFLPLDIAIEWAADHWDLTMLQARSRRIDAGTLLAFVLSIVIASRLVTRLSLNTTEAADKT